MNTFLLFIILLVFTYEFIRRMNYLEEYDKKTETEGFQNKNINQYKYLENNFSQEFERNINVKSISKDLGVKRSINQVVAATDDPLPDEFFKPIDYSLFKTDINRWVNQQRDWQESYTYFDDIINQKNAIEDYKKDKKNYDDLSIWDKLDIKKGIKKEPIPTQSYIKSIDTVNPENIDITDLAMDEYNKWFSEIINQRDRE
jgi:hypothetical protein